MARTRYRATEIEAQLHLGDGFVRYCISEEWIMPAYPETEELDEEDLARLRLIAELREVLGVNDEAVPVILHLLDQVYSLRRRVEEHFSQREE